MQFTQPYTQRTLKSYLTSTECSEKFHPPITPAILTNNLNSSEIDSSKLRRNPSIDEHFIKNQQPFILINSSQSAYARMSSVLTTEKDPSKNKPVDQDTNSTNHKVELGHTNSTQIASNTQSLRQVKQMPIQSLKQQNLQKNHKLLYIQKNQLDKTFEYTCEFEQIKKIFKQQLNKAMITLQETRGGILMKSRHSFAYHCISMFCLPIIDDETVFELKKSEHLNNSAKLSIISGNTSQFQIFKQNFMAKLWQAKKIKVPELEGIEYFFHLNNKAFKLIKQQIQTILKHRFFSKKRNSLIISPYCKAKNSQKLKIIKIIQYTKQILQALKNSTENFKQKVTVKSQICLSWAVEKKIQSLIFELVEIAKLYFVIYEQEACMIKQKIQTIKKIYTLNSLFDFLEIAKEFRLLEQCNCDFNCHLEKLLHENALPYSQAIELLSSMNFLDLPSVLLQKIQLFNRTLTAMHNKHSDTPKSLQFDMDSLLPLIIYCVIASKNTSIIIICKMMLDYLQLEECWQSQKKVLTTIEASYNYIRMEWKIAEQNYQKKI